MCDKTARKIGKMEIKNRERLKMTKRPVPEIYKNKWNDESWLTEIRLPSKYDDRMVYPFHGPKEPCPRCGKLSGLAYADNDEVYCSHCPPEGTKERLTTTAPVSDDQTDRHIPRQAPA